MTNEQFKFTAPVMLLGEAIAMGYIAGAQRREKIGYTSVANATIQDIWNPGGLYVPLAAEQGLDVVSTDNAADVVAGVGAQQVTIGYLTSDFTSKTETVTLTGSTVAHTVATDIMYVNSFRVTRAGANGVPTGAITLKRLAGAGAAVQSQIAIGQTRGRKMYYTVPKGKIYMIYSLNWASAGGSGAGKDFIKFNLRANFDSIGQAKSTVEYPFFEVATVTGGSGTVFEVPFTFPAGVTIRVTAQGNAATDAALAYCSWESILMDA